MKPFEKINLIRKVTAITSTQKLILLTIATHLGENDFCWLSISTLQKECCIKKRNSIVDNLKFLINVGYVVKVPPSQGCNSNQYRIAFNSIAGNQGLLVTNGYQASNLELLPQYPTVTRVVTDGYPKRNINNKEKKNKNNTPSGKSSDDLLDHKEIINLYHMILPMCPYVKAWTKRRTQLLDARIKEEKERQSYDWWEKFFEYVGKSKFLTGQATSFISSLEWMLRPTNILKILEGNFHHV